MMTRARSLALIVAACGLAASCNSSSSKSEPAKPTETSAPAPPSWAVKVEPIALPAGARSTEPQFTVSSRGVLLSWVEQGDKAASLKFAERTANGWSEAKQVASGDNWFLSYADMPTVMRMRDGTLVSNWYLSTNPVAEGYDILLSYSKTMARPGHAASSRIATRRRHSMGSSRCSSRLPADSV